MKCWKFIDLSIFTALLIKDKWQNTKKFRAIPDALRLLWVIQCTAYAVTATLLQLVGMTTIKSTTS